jgi:hypothetical protein
VTSEIVATKSINIIIYQHLSQAQIDSAFSAKVTVCVFVCVRARLSVLKSVKELTCKG